MRAETHKDEIKHIRTIENKLCTTEVHSLMYYINFRSSKEVLFMKSKKLVSPRKEASYWESGFTRFSFFPLIKY